MRQSESQEEDSPSLHDRLHSAPKGLLRYYILHKIAQKPIHGYEITPKGVESLAHAKEMFANFQQRFGSLRRLFIELIDPENLATFFVDGSNRQFQMAQEMLESKQNKISPADLDYILKEYTLNLERQMNWANRMLNRSKSKASPTPRQKVAKAR